MEGNGWNEDLVLVPTSKCRLFQFGSQYSYGNLGVSQTPIKNIRVRCNKNLENNNGIDFDKIYSRIHTDCVKWDMDLRYQDGSVLPMWVADMDFAAPDTVVKALQKRAEHPIYGYTFENGRFSIITADWIHKAYHWSVSSEWIAFSSSVLTSLAIVINSMTDQEDGIIIMQPVYYSFARFIRNNGRRVINCPLCKRDGRYEMDYDLIEQYARHNELVF